jgi:hypothetical protein
LAGFQWLPLQFQVLFSQLVDCGLEQGCAFFVFVEGELFGFEDRDDFLQFRMAFSEFAFQSHNFVVDF